MAEPIVLAIDQGTTGTSCALVDAKARVVASSTVEFAQHYPQPGWVEHKADEIWSSLQQAIQKLLQNSRVQVQQIQAIGITNQRESLVCWDSRTHRTLHNIIVWQCRRTTQYCQQLKSRGVEKVVHRPTGLLIDPYFSATKLNWLFNNVPEVKKHFNQGRLRVGTIDTYLLWQLTAGQSYKTDVSNASRTLLFDIHKLQWCPDLLKVFDLPSGLLDTLPKCGASSQLMGHTKGLAFLPDGIPIASLVGDQQAALFGQRCFQKAEAKCTFGTGSFILMNTGLKPKLSASLLSTVAWQLNDKTTYYALEGGAFVCGAAVQWLRDALGIIKSSAEVEPLARQVDNTGGVLVVPAFAGLGAPYWKPEARALITGLTRGSNKSHIARAVLEAMALQNVDILQAMQRDLNFDLKSLKVDGGAAANSLLMQMQSDYLGVELHRPAIVESTLMGAALLAGLGVGVWTSAEQLPTPETSIFKPQISNTARTNKLKAWHKAIDMLIQ